MHDQHRQPNYNYARDADHFGNCIVSGADMWHMNAWHSCACFDLCEDTCFMPCIAHMGLTHRGKAKVFGHCFCIGLSAHYKLFLLEFVDGVTEVLESYFPASMLENPGEVLLCASVTS
jgi:hypothetical protein